MREVKYRLWTGEEMFYIDDLYWFEEAGFHNVHDIPKHCTLMEYTGRNDKYEKLIYEGDFVHFKADGLSGFGIVYYNEKAARFEIKDIRSQTSKRGQRYYQFYEDATYRVDGNVHQNPDLIK